LEVGPDPPAVLNAFIEITPFDLMKYEVDKVSGYLRVDRPQRSSAQHPTLYGFVPRTYCDERVRRLAPAASLRVVRAAMADYDAAFAH
jgi:inorganic pyrophosphatase